jgi:hypothetical protein
MKSSDKSPLEDAIRVAARAILEWRIRNPILRQIRQHKKPEGERLFLTFTAVEM